MGRASFPSGKYRGDEAAADAERHNLPGIRTSKGGSRSLVVVDDGGDSSDEDESTTPTARETRIPDRLPCPPAPRKRRPPLACGQAQAGSGNREFFLCPPDLEAVFARRKQPAK